MDTNFLKTATLTAMHAGKLMLVSGAEISRVEDTMNRILDAAYVNSHSVFALATGIILSAENETGVITLTERITERDTNLNRIYHVNDISRELCNGNIDIYEASRQLATLKTKRQFSPLTTSISYIGVTFFFTLLLGGDIIDCAISALMGLSTALIVRIFSRYHINTFLTNLLSAFFIASIGILFQLYIMNFNLNLAIIGGIMPLVPGVTFTVALRDTLNGDYTSGMSRILEAIVIALAIAVGVAISMFIFY